MGSDRLDNYKRYVDLQLRYFMDSQPDNIEVIGVDIDTKSYRRKKIVYETCQMFGHVIVDKTTNGWHFKILLANPVSAPRAFEIRYICHDDYHRLVKDMLKWHDGQKYNENLDVLFDVKTRLRK